MRRNQLFISFIFFLLLTNIEIHAATDISRHKDAIFSGHIVKINQAAGLFRAKITASNMKYINKKNRIEVFNEQNPNIRCKGTVVGKTHNYIMVKVPDFRSCLGTINLAIGSYLHFYSDDLVENLRVGRELLELLHKKRQAINGLASEYRTALHAHMEKVNVVNGRYQILQEKMRQEWRAELTLLEEDRVASFKKYEEFQRQLTELDHKIEQYTIEAQNFTVDRWSLD